MSRALQLLAEQLEKQERQAAAQFNGAQLQLQQLEQQQQMLNQYQQNYSQEFQQRGQQGLSSYQFSHFQGFINKLEAAQEQQQAGLQQARTHVETCRSAWLSLRTRQQAIEKLLERAAERKQQEANRQEQKELDNLSIFRFHKKER